MKYTPWEFPENPFDYVKLISCSRGVGEIPKHKIGSKIAIIGAGCSGLCAAYELMKIGLHPVIYESSKNYDGTPRIGGRAYSYRFPGDPEAFAELGAMRIPAVNRTLTYYMDKFGIDYSRPFPDPLKVPTTLFFEGKKYFIPLGGILPISIRKASDTWKVLINPLIKKISKVWENSELRSEQWKEYVKQYADKSFYQVLIEHGLTRQEIKYFGSLGLGTGGFDSLYHISFIEILRLTVCQWDTDQRLVKRGVAQIPEAFWANQHQCFYWGMSSVKQLNSGQPLSAVKEIYTPHDPLGKVSITDSNGSIEKYDAVIVTCSLRALEMDIMLNRSTFSDEIWSAIQNIHMVRSGKIFIRTKDAFWKNKPPESTINCTITDEAIRGAYLFDFDNTSSGVICMSYTWEDSATKFHAMNEDERVEKCISILKNIYGKDYISNQFVESISFFWEHEKGYHGAFKLNYPGQYDDQLLLFRQPVLPSPELHNGVFLAGETTSWAGGWIEGAIHSGIDASMAVIRRLGGKPKRHT
jgi:monoamine oxidase